MDAVRIRAAVAGDVPLILELIRELALYEREADAVLATEADLLRDGFSAEHPKRFDCLIAECAGESAGFALYFHNYSTWTGRAGLHLEDLFVRPALRKRGIGRALIAAVARIALDEKCPRLQWDVLEWNTSAVGFYESLGAVMLTEWETMRVTGDALQRLGAAAGDAADMLEQ
jgi:GNAT superfamily N-acetyltransferase